METTTKDSGIDAVDNINDQNTSINERETEEKTDKPGDEKSNGITKSTLIHNTKNSEMKSNGNVKTNNVIEHSDDKSLTQKYNADTKENTPSLDVSSLRKSISSLATAGKIIFLLRFHLEISNSLTLQMRNFTPRLIFILTIYLKFLNI